MKKGKIQEKTITVKKKGRKYALDQEKTITIKKKEGRKWKTQIRMKHLASFFIYIQSNRQMTETTISD